MSNLLRAVTIILIIDAIAVFFVGVPIDFYLIPISACGYLSFKKALDSFKLFSGRKANLVFFLYCSLFFSTYLAPLIHFGLNYWMQFVTVLPAKWEPLVFILGIQNFIGIVIFNVVYAFLNHKYRPFNSRSLLKFSGGSKINYVYLFGFISLIVQLFVLAKFGGISGYVSAFEAGEDDTFSGMGLLFIVSEFLPTILILLYFLKAKTIGKLRTKPYIYMFLFILLVLALIFGGLRGSRANTLFTFLHAVALIHFFYNKFTRKEIMAGMLLIFIFMYLGKLYKQGGSEALQEYSAGSIDTESTRYNFGILNLLVEDFARADVQAYLIWRMDNFPYELKYGQTYIGDILKMLPDRIFAYEGVNKSSAGTELLYARKTDYSVRIFGFVGQHILNFGYMSAFLSFIPLAIIVFCLERWLKALDFEDIRFFLFPLFIFFIILLFNSDVDNIIRFISKRFLLLGFLLFLISKNVKRVNHKNL